MTEHAFFAHCATPAQAKTVYRKLCFEHHPDTGHGNLELMKIVNLQYHQRLAELDGQTATGTDGLDHTYHYRHDIEQAIMDMIARVLALHIPNVEIDLIGTWIWVAGDTKPFRRQLAWNKGAGLGFKWHGSRKRWYWRQHGRRMRRQSDLTWSEMQHAFGHRSFQPDDDKATSLS